MRTPTKPGDAAGEPLDDDKDEVEDDQSEAASEYPQPATDRDRSADYDGDGVEIYRDEHGRGYQIGPDGTKHYDDL